MHDLSTFRRMLVCLDLTPMDEPLIRYASLIVKIFGIDAVYFTHVTTTFELPEEIREKYPDVIAPLDETLAKEMEFSIDNFFDKPEGCDLHIDVLSGNTTDEILKRCKVKEIDIALLGRKDTLDGSGLNSRKIAKACPCSVIFVPENLQYRLEKILVSIDYSEHSKMAFEVGIDIQKRCGAKLFSNNVYRVPTGYHASGKSYEEFAEIMLENAKKDCHKFFKKLNTEGVDYEHTFSLDDDPHPADKIYLKADEIGVDMIILGSKGRTSAAAFLIGSVAEKLVMEDRNIPLFIIKEGNENLGLLQALFKI